MEAIIFHSRSGRTPKVFFWIVSCWWLKFSVVARNNDVLKKLVLEAKREYEKDAEHRVHIFLADTWVHEIIPKIERFSSISSVHMVVGDGMGHVRSGLWVLSFYSPELKICFLQIARTSWPQRNGAWSLGLLLWALLIFFTRYAERGNVMSSRL